MLVSHDRALLRETCDEFWLVTRGGVEPFDGDLDDYQRWLLELSRAGDSRREHGREGRAGTGACPPAAGAPDGERQQDRQGGEARRRSQGRRTGVRRLTRRPQGQGAAAQQAG